MCVRPNYLPETRWIMYGKLVWEIKTWALCALSQHICISKVEASVGISKCKVDNKPENENNKTETQNEIINWHSGDQYVSGVCAGVTLLSALRRSEYEPSAS